MDRFSHNDGVFGEHDLDEIQHQRPGVGVIVSENGQAQHLAHSLKLHHGIRLTTATVS